MTSVPLAANKLSYSHCACNRNTNVHYGVLYRLGWQGLLMRTLRSQVQFSRQFWL